MVMGQSPSSASYNQEGKGLPFYQGNADFGDLYPITKTWCNQPRKTAEAGDILISVRAPIGAVNIAGEECCIGRGLAAIRQNGSAVSRDYLFHCLQANRSKLEAMGTGSTFKAIGKRSLSSLAIPIYGLEKQKMIVRQLEGGNECLAAAATALTMFDALVKSRFVEMFGDGQWKRTALSEVADIQGGLTKSGKRDLLPLKLPYLRVANVLRGTLYLDEVLEIGLTAAECEKNLLVEGDLLFVEGNGSADQIGRCAVWDGSIAPCVHQNHLIRVRFDERVLPVYALAYFNAHDGREQIVARAVNTSGLFTLSTGKVKALQMPLPPLPLQQKFSDFVNNVDKSRFVARRIRETLGEYNEMTMEHVTCVKGDSL